MFWLIITIMVFPWSTLLGLALGSMIHDDEDD